MIHHETDAPMLNVLVVEDDPMNRRVVRDMLSVADVATVEAENGQAGLDLLERESVSLILMDLRMPGMDGLTAIRHIRARDDAKGRLPIIVVTADTSPTMKEDCRRAGADDILMKPVAMEALFDSMGRLLCREGSMF